MPFFSTLEHLVAFVVAVMYLSMAAIGAEDACAAQNKPATRFANASLVAATFMITMTLQHLVPEVGMFMPKAKALAAVVFSIMYLALSANTLKQENDKGAAVPASRKHYVVANVVGSSVGLLTALAAAYGVFVHDDARAITKQLY